MIFIIFLADVIATVALARNAMDGSTLAMYAAAVTGACAVGMLILMVKE